MSPEPNDRDELPELDAAAARLRQRVATSPVPDAAELLAGDRSARPSRGAAALAAAALLVAVVTAGVWWGATRESDTELAGVDTTDTAPRPPTGETESPTPVELGESVPCRPAQEVGFDLDTAQLAEVTWRDQLELDRTVAAANDYVLAAPDGVMVGFENSTEGSVVVAVFSDDLERHRTALASLVEHPDSLVVRDGVTSRTQLEALQAQLAATNEAQPGSVNFSSTSWRGLEAALRADQLPLARELARAHGSMVQLMVGAKRYVGTDDGSLRRCADDSVGPAALPTGGELGPQTQLVSTVVTGSDGDERSGQVVVGDDVLVSLIFSSATPSSWPTQPNGPDGAVLVRPGTDEVVSAETMRVRTLVGEGLRLVPPGEPVVVELVATSAAADDGDDPALPSGEYELVASMLVDGEQRLLPRVPVVLVR